MRLISLFTVVFFSANCVIATPVQILNGKGLSFADGLPEGYSIGKLRYRATIDGLVVGFEGDSREDIYAQVKAKSPDFQIPYGNATEIKEPTALLESRDPSNLKPREFI
ncbi:uncharacterized protein LY89DRAFT_740589 [Mollisia scopiformis]|uniref:Uncharacterized protein n=1 Tax=Mollisia scopiformis TaxID=149040 RepID=A0A132BET5_MOLSC|nr:uncharacterized protein LY89DRAFT_740589 [Mollisia scopiformis]KUJ10197.1 hypothetical protein LY89DRAFT_740589 [Mollisia scopiformis]